uniref:Ig-like domain-containing protein n=1 Tax=Chelydra serpentina TaxID=8475 RepID=A0A8C3T3E0_CHESE
MHNVVKSLLPLIWLSLMAASEEGIQILQSPAQVWWTPGQTAQLDCSHSLKVRRVLWYKERPSLQWIYESSPFQPSNGKYSSKVKITANTFSLIISNVQRDDSGVYYCGLVHPNFGSGTRLIVTGEFPTRQNNDMARFLKISSQKPAFENLEYLEIELFIFLYLQFLISIMGIMTVLCESTLRSMDEKHRVSARCYNFPAF